MKTRTRARLEPAKVKPGSDATQEIQLDRQHCGVLCLARQEIQCPKNGAGQPTGKRGFRPGQKVKHPKYGEGTVYQREGDGEDAKITVQFPRFGLKKLVERYAQLEKA